MNGIRIKKRQSNALTVKEWIGINNMSMTKQDLMATREYQDSDYFTQNDLEELEAMRLENEEKNYLLKELILNDIAILTV